MKKNFTLILSLLFASSSFAESQLNADVLPKLKAEAIPNNKIRLSWGQDGTNPLELKGQGSCKGKLVIDAELQSSKDLKIWNSDSNIELTSDGYSVEKDMDGPRGFWRLKYGSIRTTSADVVMVCQDGKMIKCFQKGKVPPPFSTMPAGVCPNFFIQEKASSGANSNLPEELPNSSSH